MQGNAIDNWDVMIARIETLIAESNEEQIRFVGENFYFGYMRQIEREFLNDSNNCRDKN